MIFNNCFPHFAASTSGIGQTTALQYSSNVSSESSSSSNNPYVTAPNETLSANVTQNEADDDFNVIDSCRL